MAMVERWAGFGSALGSIIFFRSVVQNHIPVTLQHCLTTWAHKLSSYLNPYLQITISEYGAERFRRSDFFLAVEAYLSDSCARSARRLKAELGKDSKNLQVSVDDHEEVTDDFAGAKFWWYASKKFSKANVISIYPGEDERRFYRVVFCRGSPRSSIPKGSTIVKRILTLTTRLVARSVALWAKGKLYGFCCFHLMAFASAVI